MKYINTRTGIVFEASSEIHGDEIEMLKEAKPVETEKPKKDKGKKTGGGK